MHFDSIKDLSVSIGAYIAVYLVDPNGAQHIIKFFMYHSLWIALAFMAYSLVKLLIEKYFALQELRVRHESKK